MSQFTTTYFSAPNVSATIVQATTENELIELMQANRHLFVRHANLSHELRLKAAELTTTAYPSLQAYRDRVNSMDEGDE